MDFGVFFAFITDLLQKMHGIINFLLQNKFMEIIDTRPTPIISQKQQISIRISLGLAVTIVLVALLFYYAWPVLQGWDHPP